MTEEWGELNINWHLKAFGASTRSFGLPMLFWSKFYSSILTPKKGVVLTPQVACVAESPLPPPKIKSAAKRATHRVELKS